ncbi:MAG: hypothetical protein ACLFQV_12910 [Vulcanimicrobiota bacterium]
MKRFLKLTSYVLALLFLSTVFAHATAQVGGTITKVAPGQRAIYIKLQKGT